MSITFLSQLPAEQNEKQRFVNIALNEIDSGAVNPLKAIAVLKHLEDIIKSIKEDPNFQSLLSEEIDKYGKGEKATALGYEISMGQRRTFDYSGCGDAVYEEFEKEKKSLSDKMKDREKFLQALRQKMVDAENGGFEISPPVCRITTYPILKEVKQGIELPADNLPF